MNNLVINSVLHDNGNTTQPIKTCLPDSLIAHQKKHSKAENKEEKDSSKCDLKIPEPVKRRPSRRNKRFWQKLEEDLKKDSKISRYPKVHPACINHIYDICSQDTRPPTLDQVFRKSVKHFADEYLIFEKKYAKLLAKVYSL